MIRVGVFGALGKMGSEAVTAVVEADGLDLVAAIDPAFATADELPGTTCVASVNELGSAALDVAIDFTHPDVVVGNIRACISRGIDVIVGTTGISEADREALSREATQAQVRVFLVPNFAIGAVLMMRFAAEAARHLPFVEITELHHDQKADAPSGTALQTAALIAAGRDGGTARARESVETTPGARGADVGDEIRIHSVRLPSLIAHQEVLLSGAGELLTIRHDSMDRKGFMPGVILAVRERTRLAPGLTIGLEHVL